MNADDGVARPGFKNARIKKDAHFYAIKRIFLMTYYISAKNAINR